MELEAVKPILEDALRVTYSENEADITVSFIGEIELFNPEILLDPFIYSMHRYILYKKIKNIVIDLGELIYCNSSGIRCFMKWISLDYNLPPESRYSIRIISNHDYHWQVTSVNIFGLIAPGIVDVEKITSK